MATENQEEVSELSRFDCKECGTKCVIKKRGKDIWIEPVKVLPEHPDYAHEKGKRLEL